MMLDAFDQTISIEFFLSSVSLYLRAKSLHVMFLDSCQRISSILYVFYADKDRFFDMRMTRVLL